MRFPSRLVFLALVLCGSVDVVRGCGIDWQIPTNHFDGVNEWGKLSYWRSIGEVNLGNGLKIPLIIGFSPNRGVSPYFGKGWMVPLLESNVVQVNERLFLLTQPDGIVRQFWKATPTDSILEGQGGWKGEIKGNDLTLWADCGWKLTFYKGKISSMTTPQNRVLTLSYADGRAYELQEGGKSILKVDSDRAGRVEGLSYGANRIAIEMGDQPRIDSVQGMNVVGGIQKSLHKLILPNGVPAIYDFGVDEKLRPKLEISGDTSRSFVWDAATGEAVRDGDWTYNITPGINQIANSKIERVNGKKQSEMWFFDRAKGVETNLAVDGTKIVKNFFVSGPVEDRIRETLTTRPDGSTVFKRFNYDDKGILRRSIIGHYNAKESPRKLTEDKRIEYDEYGRVSATYLGGILNSKVTYLGKKFVSYERF